MSNVPNTSSASGTSPTVTGRTTRFPSGQNRLTAVLAIVAVLVASAIIGTHYSSQNPTDSLNNAYLVQMPKEAPAGADSSSWYCAGPGSVAGATTLGLSIVNSSSHSVSGSIHSVTDSGTTASVPALSVPADTQAGVGSKSLAQGSYVGDDIEMAGGQVSALESVGSTGGQSVLPCSSYTSSTWYTNAGEVLGGDRLVYLLYNPTTTDAVVDISLVNDQGPISDPQDQGIYVPAGGLVVQDVSDRIFGSVYVGATIHCRLGNIVAYQLQLRPPPGSTPGETPPAGTGAVSLTLGQTATGTDWHFPEGVSSPGDPEDIYLFNPSTKASEAQVNINLDAGSTGPITESVPGESIYDFSINAESTRIPPKVGHVLSVQVIKGAPLIVTQTMGTTKPSANPTATGANSGVAVPWLTVLSGAQGAAAQWIVGGTPLTDPLSQTLAIENPGSKSVNVAVFSLGALGSPISLNSKTSLSIPGHGHAVVVLPAQDLVPTATSSGAPFILPLPPAFIVSASGPIIVETESSSAGIPGIAFSLAIPASPAAPSD